MSGRAIALAQLQTHVNAFNSIQVHHHCSVTCKAAGLLVAAPLLHAWAHLQTHVHAKNDIYFAALCLLPAGMGIKGGIARKLLKELYGTPEPSGGNFTPGSCELHCEPLNELLQCVKTSMMCCTEAAASFPCTRHVNRPSCMTTAACDVYILGNLQDVNILIDDACSVSPCRLV